MDIYINLSSKNCGCSSSFSKISIANNWKILKKKILGDKIRVAAIYGYIYKLKFKKLWVEKQLF